MQTVNVKLKAGALKGIVDLPNFADDQIVRVAISDDTVSPAVEEKKPLSKEEVIAIVNELAGSLANSPDKNKSLEEIRMERINGRYEALN